MNPAGRKALLTAARLAARGAAAARSLEPVPAAEGRRGDRLLGAVAHGGLYLAAAAAVAAFFTPALGHGGWQDGVRLAVGGVLFAEGALLVSNRRGVRRLVVLRLYRRRGPGASRAADVVRWRLAGPALALVATVALCVGIVLVAQAAASLL